MFTSLVGGPKGERSAARAGAALCLLLMLVLALPASAGAAGLLDQGFGVHGRVVGPEARGEDVAPPWTWGRTLPQTAVAPDGDILLLGPGTLSRFLPDGSPDSGFGAGGTVAVPAARGLAVDARGRALVLLADPHEIEVLRLLPDGELDPSFGAAGVATTDFGQPVAEVCEGSSKNCTREERVEATGISVDSAGRPMVAAEALTRLIEINPTEGGQDGNAVVGRLTAAGSLDISFGQNGVFTLGRTGASPLIAAAGGRGLLLAGRAKPGTMTALEVGRLRANGKTWSRFVPPTGPLGTEGVGASGGFPVAISPAAHGRTMVLWGAYIAGEPERGVPVVSRFLPNGNLDNAFGSHGLVVIRQPPGTNGPIEPTSLDGLPGGGVAIAGTVKYAAVPQRVAMLRLGPRGRPVLRNGNGGWLETGFGQTSAAGRDLVVDAAGRPTVAVSLGQDRRPALVRYRALGRTRR